MRKPNVAKPRSAAAAFSLSRRLPRLKTPLSAAAVSAPRPHPQVGRPGGPIAAALATSAAPRELSDGSPCNRCGHGEAHHPVRYVCDKYPHPDPLQICGCESERLEEICSQCGHKARWHKARHRCRERGCKCWGYEG